MRKTIAVCAAALLLMSAGKPESGVISKENGSTVINTTTICKNVEGYAGPVPVKIYIKKNQVEKVEVLKNDEGPKYMNAVKKKLIEAWNGLSIKEASKKEVDAVTGATFTSEALIKNVRQGLDYYQKNNR